MLLFNWEWESFGLHRLDMTLVSAEELEDSLTKMNGKGEGLDIRSVSKSYQEDMTSIL